jgi:hypothetical protein
MDWGTIFLLSGGLIVSFMLGCLFGVALGMSKWRGTGQQQRAGQEIEDRNTPSGEFNVVDPPPRKLRLTIDPVRFEESRDVYPN